MSRRIVIIHYPQSHREHLEARLVPSGYGRLVRMPMAFVDEYDVATLKRTLRAQTRWMTEIEPRMSIREDMFVLERVP